MFSHCSLLDRRLVERLLVLRDLGLRHAGHHNTRRVPERINVAFGQAQHACLKTPLPGLEVLDLGVQARAVRRALLDRRSQVSDERLGVRDRLGLLLVVGFAPARNLIP